jgi:lipopolysaccharide heptosyltransferase II
MRSLLLIEEYGLGDAVMSTPALEALAARYPNAAITSIGPPAVAELRAVCPLVREAVDSRLFPIGVGKTSFLRRRSFDAVVDLSGKFRTGWLAWRTRAAERVGTPWWQPPWLASTFYTEVVACRPRAHAVEHKLGLARALGADDVPDRLRIWLTHQDEAQAERWLGERGTDSPIALNPGGASRGRQWTAEGFAEVCRLLAGRGIRCVITGGTQDRAVAERISEGSGASPSIAAGELSVRGTAALLSRCAAVVTGDTGPMHLAAAVGTPIAALYGRNDPCWTKPWRAAHVVVSKGLECSPCRGRPRMSSRRCRRNYACMTEITPAEVLQALDSLLQQAP